MKIPRGGIGNIFVLKLQQHNKNWPSSLSPFWMAKLHSNPMIRWLFLGQESAKIRVTADTGLNGVLDCAVGEGHLWKDDDGFKKHID